MTRLWFLLFLSLCSCGGGFGNVINKTTTGYFYGGFCAIRNPDASVEVCVDFNSNDVSVNNVQCSTVEKARYSAAGTSDWQGGLPYDVCSQQNVNLVRVGSCALGDRTVRYFSNQWISADAQTDCSGRSGAWSIN